MDLFTKGAASVAIVAVLSLAAYGAATLVSAAGAPAVRAAAGPQGTGGMMRGEAPPVTGVASAQPPGDEMTQICAAHMAEMAQANTPQQMVQLCNAHMNNPAMQRMMGEMMRGMMGGMMGRETALWRNGPDIR